MWKRTNVYIVLFINLLLLSTCFSTAYGLSCSSLSTSSTCFAARAQPVLSFPDVDLCYSSSQIGSLAAINGNPGNAGLSGLSATYINAGDTFAYNGFVTNVLVEFMTGGGTGSITLMNVQGTPPFFKHVPNSGNYTFNSVTVPSSTKQLNLTIPAFQFNVTSGSMLGLYVSSDLGSLRLRSDGATSKLYVYTQGTFPASSSAVALTRLNSASDTQLVVKTTFKHADGNAPAVCFGTFCHWSGTECLTGAATKCEHYTSDTVGCESGILSNCTMDNVSGLCKDNCNSVDLVSCLDGTSGCHVDFSPPAPACVGGASTRPRTQAECSSVYGFWDNYISTPGYCFANVAQSHVLRNCSFWNGLSPVSTLQTACNVHGCVFDSYDNQCHELGYINPITNGNTNNSTYINPALDLFHQRDITFYESHITLSSVGPVLGFKILVPLACTPNHPSFEGLAVGSFNPSTASMYSTTSDACISSNFTSVLPEPHPELVSSCASLMTQAYTLCQTTGTLDFSVFPALRQLYGEITIGEGSLIKSCTVHPSRTDAIVLVVQQELDALVSKCGQMDAILTVGVNGHNVYDVSFTWYARIYDSVLTSSFQYVVGQVVQSYRIEQTSQTTFTISAGVDSEFHSHFIGHTDVSVGVVGGETYYQRQMFFMLIWDVSTSGSQYVIGPRSIADFTVSNNTCYGDLVLYMNPESTYCDSTQCKFFMTAATAPRACDTYADPELCFSTCSSDSDIVNVEQDGKHLFYVTPYICPAPFGTGHASSCIPLYGLPTSIATDDRIYVLLTDQFTSLPDITEIPAMNITFGVIGHPSQTVDALAGDSTVDVQLPMQMYTATEIPGFYIKLKDSSLLSTWVLNIINITINPLDTLTLEPTSPESVITYDQVAAHAIYFPRRLRLHQQCGINICPAASECSTFRGCDSFGVTMQTLLELSSSIYYKWTIVIEILNPSIGASFFTTLSVRSSESVENNPSGRTLMSHVSQESSSSTPYMSSGDLQSMVGWVIGYSHNSGSSGTGGSSTGEHISSSLDDMSTSDISTWVGVSLASFLGGLFLCLICAWFVLFAKDKRATECQEEYEMECTCR